LEDCGYSQTVLSHHLSLCRVQLHTFIAACCTSISTLEMRLCNLLAEP
jgi:hypothetical protein